MVEKNRGVGVDMLRFGKQSFLQFKNMFIP